MGKVLLFVYGTLKKGFNRSHLLREQRYIGIARTESKYAMHGYGGFPAMIDALSNAGVAFDKRVYGELYEVDDDCLLVLDKVEGTDKGLFERRGVHLDEITMSSLPVSKNTWNELSRKVAQAYFFKKNLAGAADCGPVWHLD